MTSLEIAGMAAMASLVAIAAVGSIGLVRIRRRAQQDRESLEAATAITAALGDEALFLAGILSAVDTVIILYDRELRVRNVNERFDEMFGVQGSSVIGRPIAALQQSLVPNFASPDEYREITSVRSETTNAELPMVGGRWVRWSRHAVDQGGESIGMISIFRDITEQREAEATRKKLLDELERRATTDPLTGLANRRAGSEALERETALARRHGHALSVALFDIDHFKKVNDDLGHDVGDVVIREFARVLRLAARATDVVARWGGEEFLVLLLHTDLEGGRIFGERVRELLAKGQPWEALRDPKTGHLRQITASCGIATLAPDDEGDLVRRADEALYDAKRAGRDRVATR